MSVSAQDLLHGAALARLFRPGRELRITASEALRSTYLVATEVRCVAVMFKYATKKTSPWQFTFSADQAAVLEGLDRQHGQRDVYLALICHTDGVCCVQLSELDEVGVELDQLANTALYVKRPRRGSYWLRGPGRVDLGRAIPLSRWPDELYEERP